MSKGKFIVFESIDGAGGSTQSDCLANWLREKKIFVETTKEPTEGPIGSVVRQTIRNRVKIDPCVLALAFASDRIDHLTNEQDGILRSLDKGHWVISDRYVLSSLAYQSIDYDVDWVIEINKFAIDPDVTIFIDVPVDECLNRMSGRSSIEELYHKKEKLEKILVNYRKLIAKGRFVGRLITLDGSRSKDEVFQEMILEFEKWYDKMEE